jgi:hypothetical protein
MALSLREYPKAKHQDQGQENQQEETSHLQRQSIDAFFRLDYGPHFAPP